MNWFTKELIAGSVSAEKKAEKVQEHGGCDHVTQDPSLLYVIQYENDSFGREGYCCCQACYEASQAKEAERIVTCQECHAKVPKSETVTWKWYDFSFQSGDQPFIICNNCKNKEKHKKRVEEDRLLMERELYE